MPDHGLTTLNAISVDVEEFYHAENLASLISPADWHRQESRVEYSTHRVLDLFSRLEIHGTFFIMGQIARRRPALVRDIADAGHEIASHGYSHRLVYRQTPAQFSRDVARTKRLLEDLSGAPVLGYRAPNFSVRSDTDWAYDTLIQAGYRYDSSLYPIRHPRYGNREKDTTPQRLTRQAGTLLLFPLAVRSLSLFGCRVRFPLAGGAYWRLFPACYTHWGISSLNKRESRPAICYFHPWEIDAGQPYLSALSLLTRLRHYGGIERFEKKLEYLLSSFRFAPIWEVAHFHYKSELGILSEGSSPIGQP